MLSYPAIQVATKVYFGVQALPVGPSAYKCRCINIVLGN